MALEQRTLYSLATSVMKKYIAVYLQLSKVTNGLTNLQELHVVELDQKLIVLSGIGSPLDPKTIDPSEVVKEWKRLRAIPFEVEPAITRGVYVELRRMTEEFVDTIDRDTSGFHLFEANYIAENAHFLPIFQRLANITSKAAIKRVVGSVSDNNISKPASEKLAAILNERQPGRVMTRAQLLQSIEPTLEGIVRDLVGRVLLESIVADALDSEGVAYKREAEYNNLVGVVYDFRADFVIPNDLDPKAFIEVRKSSSRHASLYAKDKMFSAINWKGKNKELLAVLVVDGPWTAQTLKVMAKVFDYVVPINLVSEMVEAISAYVAGDKSKLKWLIDFSIKSNK